MYAYRELQRIHLEITDKCNAACPQCPRNDQGGVVNPLLPLVELSLADVQKILDEPLVKQLKHVYLCGNYGDAIMAKETLEILQYLRRTNPNIRLGLHTNGSARTAEWWAELAKLMPKGKGYARFGIDGLEDTNHLYRRNTKWSTIMRNVEAFIKAGGNAEWDYIVFRHNEHQVEEARSLAKRMGFTLFNPKKTGRFFDYEELKAVDSTPVKSATGEVEYYLETPLSPEWNNEALLNVDSLNSKYGDMTQYLDGVEISCKVDNEKSVYISADGYALPCCWLAGHIYRRSCREKDPVLLMIKGLGGEQKINAKRRPLKEIIDGPFFQELVPGSWSKKSIAAGKLEECARTCGVEFRQFDEQFKRSQAARENEV